IEPPIFGAAVGVDGDRFIAATARHDVGVAAEKLLRHVDFLLVALGTDRPLRAAEIVAAGPYPKRVAAEPQAIFARDGRAKTAPARGESRAVVARNPAGRFEFPRLGIGFGRCRGGGATAIDVRLGLEAEDREFRPVGIAAVTTADEAGI